VPAGRRGGMRARRNLSACSASAGRRRDASSRALLALGRPRAAVLFPEALALLRRRPTPLLTEPLALLRRQLAEALARLGALLRGHVSPALIVLHDALPLGGRHRLPLAVALEDVLAPPARGFATARDCVRRSRAPRGRASRAPRSAAPGPTRRRASRPARARAERELPAPNGRSWSPDLPGRRLGLWLPIEDGQRL